ncbi:MAG: hypothetical protein PWQ20_623 [Thermotogaceae bacterium]|jgi:hypothetical protein|nr:hypothetical protein [Thermotogaceae bacterium]MDN5337553.1 hypothetical protein [Thermotogaceae bacterium]
MEKTVLFKNARVFDFKVEDFVQKDLLVINGIIVEISRNLDKIGFKEINLSGQYVLPGLIDSHLHLISYGRQLSNYDLSNFSKLHEMLDFLKEKDNSELLVARGWNDDLLDKKPERSVLDTFFPDKPVILVRKCGHIAVANTQLLLKFQLSKIKSAEIDMENGLISENALSEVMKLIESEEKIESYIQKAQENLKSFGITSVISNDIFVEKFDKIKEALLKFKNLRVFDEITINSQNDIESIVSRKAFKKYNDFFYVTSVKLFADGSFGARTAALKKPYKDDSENIGMLLKSDEELSEIFLKSKEFGIRLSIHAIGDRAIEQILKIAEKTGSPGEKIRIIHFQIADDELIKSTKEKGINVTIQPIFKRSDEILVEKIFDEERKKHVYPFIKLKNRGILISSSSDAPVESPNPYLGMNILINEGFTEVDALKTYTLNPAKMFGIENILGSIEKNKFADFCIFKENPFEKIKTNPDGLSPSLVVLNGELVFQNK